MATRARALQNGWTSRRDLLDEAEARLSVLGRAAHKARWLWPDLPDLPDMVAKAPKALKSQAEKRAWADSRINELEAGKVEAMQAALSGGRRLEAVFIKGELQLLADGADGEPDLSRRDGGPSG